MKMIVAELWGTKAAHFICQEVNLMLLVDLIKSRSGS